MPTSPINSPDRGASAAHYHHIKLTVTNSTQDQSRQLFKAIDSIYASPDDGPSFQLSTPWILLKKCLPKPHGYQRLDTSGGRQTEDIELTQITTQGADQQAGTSASTAFEAPAHSPSPHKQCSFAKKIGFIAASTIGVGTLLVTVTYPLVSRAMTIEAEQGGDPIV